MLRIRNCIADRGSLWPTGSLLIGPLIVIPLHGFLKLFDRLLVNLFDAPDFPELGRWLPRLLSLRLFDDSRRDEIDG